MSRSSMAVAALSTVVEWYDDRRACTGRTASPAPHAGNPTRPEQAQGV